MRIIEHISEMRAWSEAERRQGRRIVLVPTMGFLHEGHLSLVREGRERGEKLVVSIFVNPAQFAPHEDYRAYPRDLQRDCDLLRKEGVDLVFNPPVEEMYPHGFQTHVEVEELAKPLCGAFRPGHFRGVATVVAKLFNVVRPHVAIFGLKDYQQFRIVCQMVQDLKFDVEIIGHPIVREHDGLALSSRNTYLSPKEREAALGLSRSVKIAGLMVREGERESRRIIGAVKTELDKEISARVEYVKVCDPKTLKEIERIEGEALLALAVWVGKARLIDNTLLKSPLG